MTNSAINDHRLCSAPMCRLFGRLFTDCRHILGAVLSVLLSPLIIAATVWADSKCLEATNEIEKGVQLADGTAAEEIFYRKAIELCPRLAEAHFNLGINLAKQGRYEDAIAALRKAKSERNDPQFGVALGNSILASGDTAGAEKEYKAVLSEAPNTVEAHQGLGAVYERLGKLDQAEDALRSAMQLNANDPLSYYNLALVLERQKKQDEAITSLETALAKKSDFVEAYGALGRLYVETGKFEKAEQTLLKATFLGPKDAGAWLSLGALYERQQRYEPAREAFEKVLTLQPNNISALTNLAIVAAELGKFDEAKQKLELAKGAAPDSARVRAVYGWLALKQRNLVEAEGHLVASTKLDDKSAQAINNLGVLYELKGEPEKAKAEFLKAQRLDPNLEQASHNVERLKD